MPNLVVLSPETLISVLGLLKENIDCSGMKLHLDEVFSFVDRGGLYSNSKKLSNVYEIKPNEEGIYVLAPGGYRIRYREIVKVPENTIAIAIPRSTLLRIGATIHTAVWDPGY
ncbi:MAG: hypothetical protein QW725_00680, partial [Ignisphaera sp.]